MFQHEGPERTASQNRILASYLACIGGFVNSVGFVLVGNFTSHVTGNVGRFASVLSHGLVGEATAIVAMITAFFVGATVATLIIEGAPGAHRARGYGAALTLEAVLLVLVALVVGSELPATLGLSAAMGMQNSMVTRLSGAVVRTTHLTGVVTDLGIETGRWLRWAYARLAGKGTGRGNGSESPSPGATRITLLATVASSFSAGALLGAFAGARFHEHALYVAAVAIFLGAASAFRSAFRPAPKI